MTRLILLDFKLLLKNKLFYLKLILFPLILILILGTVLGRSDDIKISPFKVAVLNEDSPSGVQSGTSLGQLFCNDVLKSSGVSSTVQTVAVSGDSQGEQMIKDGQAAIYLRIPKDFTNDYLNGKSSTIYKNDENAQSVQKELIDSLINSFASGVDAKASLLTAVGKEGESLKLSSGEVQHVLELLSSSNTAKIQIPMKSPNGDRKPISTMQYCSVGMTVMFSILTAFILVHSVVADKLNGTYSRIESTPLRRSSYLIGKLLGVSVSLIVQMLILVAFTSLIYQVDWGNIGLVLLITVLYGMAVGAISLAMGLLARNQTSISSYSSIILWGLSFLGGSLISIDSFPGPLLSLQKWIPNGAALDAYIGVANGNGWSGIAGYLFCIAAYIVVFLLFAAYIQKNPGGEKTNAQLIKNAA